MSTRNLEPGSDEERMRAMARPPSDPPRTGGDPSETAGGEKPAAGRRRPGRDTLKKQLEAVQERLQSAPSEEPDLPTIDELPADDRMASDQRAAARAHAVVGLPEHAEAPTLADRLVEVPAGEARPDKPEGLRTEDQLRKLPAAPAHLPTLQKGLPDAAIEAAIERHERKLDAVAHLADKGYPVGDLLDEIRAERQIPHRAPLPDEPTEAAGAAPGSALAAQVDTLPIQKPARWPAIVALAAILAAAGLVALWLRGRPEDPKTTGDAPGASSAALGATSVPPVRATPPTASTEPSGPPSAATSASASAPPPWKPAPPPTSSTAASPPPPAISSTGPIPQDD
jgi:hypothetical protein